MNELMNYILLFLRPTLQAANPHSSRANGTEILGRAAGRWIERARRDQRREDIIAEELRLATRALAGLRHGRRGGHFGRNFP